MIQRRRFMAGLGTLFAAPAIVRAASLMPVSVVRPPLSLAMTWDIYLDKILAPAAAKLAADIMEDVLTTGQARFFTDQDLLGYLDAA
jgi:hypothetical protein